MKTQTLLPLLVLLALPAVVQAQFAYTTNNGAITITDYTGHGGAVIIPSTINGLPVTAIGNDSFSLSFSLTSVTIPSSITSIGQYAFDNCTSLATVVIPNSVTTIGDDAFARCSSLTSVTIPSSVTNIGGWVFGYCTSLTNVTISSGVTSIEMYAFAYCSSLPGVTIPGSVTNIESAAFASCNSLTAIAVDGANSFYSSVAGVLFDNSQTTLIECPGGKAGSYTVPNSVTKIGDWAFYSCASLTNVTISGSVTNIGGATFYDCTSLAAITVDAQNAFYSSVDGVLFNKNQTTLNEYPADKAGTSYTIPNSVTRLGYGAFDSCSSLTSVAIPSTITNIGNGVFQGCTRLTNVAIPDGVTTIPLGMFSGCSSLPSVTIPNTVTSIGFDAFSMCWSLKMLTLPSGLTSIGGGAFEATRLTNITIPGSVTIIGQNAFALCYSLAGVYFKGNAPPAAYPLFGNDNSLTVYYLPGTTGWGKTYRDRPTALWNPSIQTTNASFGVRTNRFGFTIAGTTNIPIVVEASVNLATASWTALQTGTLTNGSIYFSDAQWTNHPARFYRIRSP